MIADQKTKVVAGGKREYDLGKSLRGRQGPNHEHLPRKSLDFMPNKRGNHWKVLNCIVYDLHFVDIILECLWRTDFRDKSGKWEVSWGGSRSNVIAKRPRKEMVSKMKE